VQPTPRRGWLGGARGHGDLGREQRPRGQGVSFRRVALAAERAGIDAAGNEPRRRRVRKESVPFPRDPHIIRVPLRRLRP
jgi:hypothetical protein